MAAAWAGYALLTAVLFAAAGRAGERLLAGLGRPRRWAWAAAVAGAVLGAPVLVAGLEAAALHTGPAVERPLELVAGEASGVEPSAAGDFAAAGGRTVRGWLAALNPWVATGWIVASVVYCLRLLGRWFGLRGASRPWREADGVSIRTHPDRGPAALGWSRAVILLPDWFFDLDAADRTIVLEHEREHVRAGDHRLLLVAAILLGAAPWNPALRWSVRRLREAVELDCDRRLADGPVDRADYARVLLEAQRRIAGTPAPFAASASEGCIGRRVRSLLRPDRGPGRRSAVVAGAAAVACLAAIGLAAGHLQASGLLETGLSPRGAGSVAADGVRCREVDDAGHRTDVIARLRRSAATTGATVEVREEPGLRTGDGLVAAAVGRAGRRPACRVEAGALRVDLEPPPGRDTVRLAVSPGARVKVLDERTGRTAAIHTAAPGEPPVRCAFGPRDRFACRESGG